MKTILGFLLGALSGIVFSAGVYLGSLPEPVTPAQAQPVYVERLVQLRVEGVRDSNTTGRYQRFSCRPE